MLNNHKTIIEDWFCLWRKLDSDEYQISSPISLRVELFEEYLRSWNIVVGVIGSLKVGKSTLLNTLVNRNDLLKTKHTEATSSMTAIRMRKNINPEDPDTALVVFANGCAFEFMDEEELSIDDLEEAQNLIEDEEYLRLIRSATLYFGRDKIDNMKEIRKRLKFASNEWSNYNKGKRTRLQLPQRFRLDIRFAKRRPKLIEIDYKKMDILHKYMSVGKNSQHRTVARIILKLDSRHALNRNFELIDLPGRCSRNRWRNTLSNLVANSALDERWIIKWSTEDSASSNEFLGALSGRNSWKTKSERYIVSRMNSALESVTEDYNDLQQESVDGKRIFAKWCDRTWRSFLLRNLPDKEEKTMSISDRSVFLSSTENHHNALTVANGRRIENPVRLGLEVLLLATSHDQAIRIDGDYVYSRLALIVKLTDMVDTEAQAVLETFRQTSKNEFKRRIDNAEQYLDQSQDILAQMHDAIESSNKRFSNKELHIESFSQKNLRKWGERDFIAYVASEQQLLINELKPLCSKLVATRKRLLEHKDLQVFKYIFELDSISFGKAKGGAIIDELSGFFSKALDSINIFRIFSRKASLKETHRKKAAEKAIALLERKRMKILRTATEWIDDHETDNDEISDVLRDRQKNLRQLQNEFLQHRKELRLRAKHLAQTIEEMRNLCEQARTLGSKKRQKQYRLNTTAKEWQELASGNKTSLCVEMDKSIKDGNTSRISINASRISSQFPLFQINLKNFLQRTKSKWPRLDNICISLRFSDDKPAKRLIIAGKITDRTYYLRGRTAESEGKPYILPKGGRPVMLIDLECLALSVFPEEVIQQWVTYRTTMFDAINAAKKKKQEPSMISKLMNKA